MRGRRRQGQCLDRDRTVQPRDEVELTPSPAVLTTNSACRACDQQSAGSRFLQKLNAGRDVEKGPYYTVISTTHDEVVTPYTSQALAGPESHVTNLVIQDYCPADPIEHDQTPNDPVVQQIVSAALNRENGPANPRFQPTC